MVDCCLMDTVRFRVKVKVSVWEKKNLGMDGGDERTMWISLIPLECTLKMFEMVTVLSIVNHNNKKEI